MNFEQIKHNIIALFRSMFILFTVKRKKVLEKIIEIVEINEI